MGPCAFPQCMHCALVVCPRYRHLMEDLITLLPHCKKERGALCPPPLYIGPSALPHSMCGALVVCPRYRHLMEDLITLLPHCKKDSKLDVSKGETLTSALNELADLRSCSSCVFFEVGSALPVQPWYTGPLVLQASGLGGMVCSPGKPVVCRGCVALCPCPEGASLCKCAWGFPVQVCML